MTTDAWKSLIIKLLLMVLTPLALQLHLQADTGVLTMLATDAADIIVLLYGIYRTYNSKSVPHDAIALAPVAGPLSDLKKGDHVGIDTGEEGTGGIAKVIGAILVAFLVVSMAWSTPVFAQARLPALTGNIAKDFAPKADTAAPSPAGLDGALTRFGEGVQKIEKALVDKGIADLNAAITDATNHNDNISLPCWKANLALLQSLPSQWDTPPTMPMGIALSLQVQRDLLNSITGNDAGSLKVACAALWGDQLKIVANVGALIGVRVATGGLF